jgi:hypothetical protein
MKNALATVQQHIDAHSDKLNGYIRRADDEQAQRDSLHKTQQAQLGEELAACGDRIAHCHSELLKHCSDCEKRLERKPMASVAGAPRAAVVGDDVQNLVVRVQKLEANQKIACEAQAALAGQIDRAYDATVDMMNDRVSKLQDVSGPLLPIPEQSMSRVDVPDDRIAQLYAMGNQHRMLLMDALSQSTAHSSRFDRVERRIDALELGLGNLMAAPPDVAGDPHHDVTILGSKMRIVDERDMGDHSRLVQELKALTQRTGFMSQDLVKVKSILGRLREEICDVVLQIMDEFQVIRKNTPGLEQLPALNLGSCIPSFFNNPSFSSKRRGPSDDDEEDERTPHKPVPEHDLSAPASTGREPPRSPAPALTTVPRGRNVSGLLHLISRPSTKQRTSESNATRQRPGQSSRVAAVTATIMTPAELLRGRPIPCLSRRSSGRPSRLSRWRIFTQ